MTTAHRSRSVGPFPVVAGTFAFIAVAASFVGSGALGNCAAVPEAQRQHPIGPYLIVAAPPLVTFFVLAYFALGYRSRRARSMALVATLAMTAVVGLLSLAFLQPYCGF
ncbi:MAG TPA: hypothetical protein VIK65_04455 [Candidatus Limnocylindrales bacterium]